MGTVVVQRMSTVLYSLTLSCCWHPLQAPFGPLHAARTLLSFLQDDGESDGEVDKDARWGELEEYEEESEEEEEEEEDDGAAPRT